MRVTNISRRMHDKCALLVSECVLPLRTTHRCRGQGVVEVATEKATFGAGCFWGVEAKLSELTGMLNTETGYEGGTTQNPTYKDVCTDRTGHAEVVEVTFDPSRVSYDNLLDAFFSMHDPTQLNRQGPDSGTQYRSVIFTHTAAQRAEAESRVRELNACGIFRSPVVTAVEPARTFWKAEEFHQRYLEKRNMVACHI